MRKLVSLVGVLVLALGSSLSAAAQSSAADQKPHYIGYCLPTTQGPFMSMLSEKIPETLKACGAKIETVSADNSASKQLEQIENFITMGVDELVIMAVDPTSLTDTLTKAMKKGIKVVAFTTETKVYDIFIGSDEFIVGKEEAAMASAWIDRKFPTAKPGSVEVAIFEYRGGPEWVKRANGLAEIATMNPKVKVAKVVGVDTTTAGGQSAADNLFLEDKNVKVVLCHNSDTAQGVNASVMAQNSAIKDKASFAVFGADWNEDTGRKIIASKSGGSVFRGAILMGGSLAQLFQDTYDGCLAVYSKSYNHRKLAELTQITADNADKYVK